MGLFGHYISKNGLKELEKYKYSSGSPTLLDRILAPWWNFVVDLMPMWLAPNVLTLLGFLFSCLHFFVIIIPCPTLTEPVPRLASFLAGVFLFLYQTFDAIDGKQARRTKSSSPLGTLFDHGCDVVTSTIVALATIGVCKAGHGAASFLVLTVSAQLCQYLYMWWEYYFKVFYTNPGYAAGVTEAQFGVILFCFISAFVGPNIWDTELLIYLPIAIRKWLATSIGITSFLLKDVAIYGILINNIICCLYLIFLGLSKLQSRSRLTASLQVLSFLSFLWMEWIFYAASIENGANHMAMYIVMVAVYSTTCIRMLISSCSNRIYRPFQWPLLPFYLTAFYIYFAPRYNLPGWVYLKSHFFLFFALVLSWQVLYLSDFLVTTVDDICSHLGISCFSLEKRKKKQ